VPIVPSTPLTPRLLSKTMRVAMTQMLDDVPEVFAAAVRAHFRHKHLAIRRQVQARGCGCRQIAGASTYLSTTHSIDAPSQEWVGLAAERKGRLRSRVPGFDPRMGGAHAFTTSQHLGFVHQLYIPTLGDITHAAEELLEKLDALVAASEEPEPTIVL